MGKKVDLNARRFNNNIKKSNHNFNRYNNPANLSQEDIDSENELNQNASGLGASSFQREYELPKSANLTIKMPITIKVTITALVIAIPLLMLMIFVVIFGTEDSSGGIIGLGGYSYYPDSCTNVKVNSNIVSIDEYVEGVVSNKADNLTIETLKVLTIAVRTELIQNSERIGNTPDECYYEISDSSIQYNENNSNDLVSQAVNDTRGLLITMNDDPKAYYDDSCVYTASQATELDSSNTYTNDNYYIKYGEETIGGTNFQSISKTYINIGSLSDYAQKAENGNPCIDNTGYGISLNGALYLEKYEGYTWKEIIEYYYQEESEIMSIYKGYGYTGEFPIDPDNELYTSNIQFLIDTSLSEYLESRGSSIDEYNQYIKSSIEEAGVGTREGVITAAVTLIGSLAEQGIKLNYQWGGKSTQIGVNGNWGNQLSNEVLNYNCGPESYGKVYNDSSKCFNNYKWSSFDCSGFINWAIINGMEDLSISEAQIYNLERIELNSTSAVCKPGGMLKSEGHIALVVGLDDENNRYIVAESTGSNVNNGTGGVKLSYYEYGRSGYECINLDEIYGD